MDKIQFKKSLVAFTFIEQFQKYNSETAACVLIIIGQILISIAQAIIKKSHVSIYQYLYQRSTIIIITIFFTSKDNFYPAGQQNLLMLMGFLLASSSPFFFMSLKSISMSEGLVINQMNTIWAQVMAFYIFGEIITKTRIRNITICFVGLLLIARPTDILESSSNFDHLQGCISGLIASLLGASSFVSVRKISTQTSSTIIALYFHVGLVFVGSLGIIFLEIKQEYSVEYLSNLILAAITTYSSNMLFYKALKMFPYSKLAPYTYSNVLVSLLIDYFVFNHLPCILSIFGGAIIAISIILSLRSN